ncbi:MAG: acyltransferase family protein [Rhodobacteraceae bacterium]|nr:acyltransferase family protein [Paracoccaceae bacterium]
MTGASSGLGRALFVFNRTFFMGFFFLISGYFLDASLARNGPWGVIRNRLVRRGIPLVVVVVFVFGSIGYALYGAALGYLEFIFPNYLGGGNAEFGHLWFIAHLLVYVVLYVLLRGLFPVLGTAGAHLAPPGNLAIASYAVMIGGVLALVRLTWPIDTWVRVFGLVPGEPAHMPFYLSLFGIGILAGRAAWFDRLQVRVALVWFAGGAAIFAVLAVLATPRLAQPDTAAMRIAWALLEPVVGIGMILGLIVLFRRYLASTGPWLRRLEGNIYGIYLIHLFVVIAFQMALVGMAWPALLKFCVVTFGTLAISWPVIAVLRRVPGVRTVI